MESHHYSQIVPTLAGVSGRLKTNALAFLKRLLKLFSLIMRKDPASVQYQAGMSVAEQYYELE